MKIISVREAVSLLAVAIIPALLLGGIGAMNGRGSEAVWTFAITIRSTVLASIFVGLPSIYILDRLQLRGLRHYIMVGVGVSVILAIIFVYPSLSQDRELLGTGSYLVQYGVLLLLSLMTTALYWILARPDRKDAK